MRFSAVGEGIFLLEGEVGRQSLSTYLIEEGAIVEPGPASFCLYIEKGLKELGYDPSRICYIIPTHIHLDHGGGAGYLASKFPQAKVIVHPIGARHLINPERLIASTKLSFGEEFEQIYGYILPITQEQIYIPKDGEMLSLRGRELQILYSPGHAPHHISIFDLKTGGLFSGEALGVPLPGTSFSIPYASPPGFDLELYLQTIDKLKALSPKLIFYSHNGIGKTPQALINSVIENTKKFGEIILEGLKVGEDARQIEQRLKAFFLKDIPAYVFLDITISGYIFYFKKKGLV